MPWEVGPTMAHVGDPVGMNVVLRGQTKPMVSGCGAVERLAFHLARL